MLLGRRPWGGLVLLVLVHLAGACAPDECGESWAWDLGSAVGDAVDAAVVDDVAGDAAVADAAPEDAISDGEDVPTVAGACDNPDDRAIIDGPGFADLSQACGMDCMNDAARCTECMAGDPVNLSRDCAACYGETIACTITHCLFPCMDSASTECLDCQERNCNPALRACSGVDGSKK